MRLDESRLALEPRSVGAAIDLAILFYRQNALRLFSLTLLFGGPPVAIGALRAGSGDGWLWAILLFFFLSPFLGAALVAGTGHHVFGEELTVIGSLRHLRTRAAALVLLLPLGRGFLAVVGLLSCGTFWVPLAARYGFLSEVLLLERLSGLRVGKRIEEILRNHFLEACGRYTTIVSFAAALSVTLFLLVDLGSQFLFGLPVFVGKLSRAVAFEDGANLLAYDPLLVATLSATWWLVYPIARLSWFFCYLDARIRKEGWDLEIAFRIEARRLGVPA